MANIEEMGTHACQCRNFRDARTGEHLACVAETTRTFAPGHDARLKGFLIKVGRLGHMIKVAGLPGEVTAAQAASVFGFADMVTRGIRREAIAPRPTRAQRAPEPGKITSVQVGPDVVRLRSDQIARTERASARVGRWTYDGRIDWYDRADDGEPVAVFSYTDRNSIERHTATFQQAATAR
jgi:hypothetical protein